MSMQGKVAIVTGASGGIGLAIAQRYAREGAKVILCDIQAEQGRLEAQRIVAEGYQAWFIHCDAADETQVESLVDRAEQLAGPIDIAVCSAGITGPSNAFHISETADFKNVLGVNLIGPYLVGKFVAQRMLATERRGTIIHISSVGAVLGVAESFAYCVSKAGLGMLTKTMALAMAPHGIRVNAIGPGPTDSPLTEHLDENARQIMLSRTPMGRFGEPSEIAGIAVFLAGPDASYITGQTLYADGGRLALNYVVGSVANARTT
ncbi:SDR family NAD(P)-dependent oxidoreductase [Pseudomonas sp. RGM2987]|uniref:SDR family NAD(P)-dependent oxidoreductase n=1 Tax=Pseudomonas sp. RGM2987 TaxID=2930090 RepID=UPI001FD713D1|nr:SDR family NAD(P)-dependent oxidoreductase [Pseudomonas sp. RGM2987]MCJ8206446.1 SDR family oxidoreductase [Pseudomonas sp. RGM2987]